MSSDTKEKVKQMAEEGRKYNTYKLAKSYNLGRVILVLVALIIIVCILFL